MSFSTSDPSNSHIVSIGTALAAVAVLASIEKSRARSDFMTPFILGGSLVVMVGFGFVFKKLIKYMDDQSPK